MSPGIAAALVEAHPGIRVTITPNGVDSDRFAPDAAARAQVRDDEGVGDDVVLLFVGGNWAHKGLALAIEATGRLVASGAPVRLWVVGRGDAERYGRLARECDVDDRVTFFGFRSDPERFFCAADVFVLPTRSETFCIAAFEAAAAGLPLVMTDVGDVAALVHDGAGGQLVRRDVDDVVEAVATYVADTDRRRSDGDTARNARPPTRGPRAPTPSPRCTGTSSTTRGVDDRRAAPDRDHRAAAPSVGAARLPR